MEDPRHLRQEAMDVAKMFGLGLIEDEQAKAILQQTYIMLTEVAVKKDSRAFARLVRIPLMVAKVADDLGFALPGQTHADIDFPDLDMVQSVEDAHYGYLEAYADAKQDRRIQER